MARYNIALLPNDPDAQKFYTDISRKYFSAIHDDYVLGPSAFAHVTLCQFYADSPEKAIAAYKTFAHKKPFNLVVKAFRARPGILVNSGTFIAEYAVENTPDLTDNQKKCHQHLVNIGLQALTPFKKYSPHITVARLRSVPDEAALPPAGLMYDNGTLAFSPAVGTSTESGMLTSILCQ